MRLPDGIYREVKHFFSGHACWHDMRLVRPTLPNCSNVAIPGIVKVGEPGSGEQFLEFHRQMIRNFKWIVLHTTGNLDAYKPWQQLPPFLVEIFNENTPGFLDGALAGIARLLDDDNVDRLGIFLERKHIDRPASGIHDLVHATIDFYERENVDAILWEDASMRDMRAAPHNEHFWGLHGWIDEFYAEWQRRHRIPVDQTPLMPSLHGGHVHLA